MNIKELTPEPTEEFQVHSPDLQGGDNFRAFEANKKRDESAEGSTAGEDLEAFGLAFREMNGASNLFDWAEFDSGTMFSEDSPEFLSTWNQDAILSHMDRNEFGMEHYNRLSKANNQNTLAAITDGIYQDNAIKDKIQTHITRTSQTVGSVSGAFLDLDIAFPAAKISRLATVADIMRLNAVVIGSQTVWEVAHSHVNEDYTTSDAIMSIAMMGVITAGVSVRQMKKYDGLEQQAKANKIDAETSHDNFNAADVSAREATVKGQSFDPNKMTRTKSTMRPATVSSVVDELNSNAVVVKSQKVDTDANFASKIDGEIDDIEIKPTTDKDVSVGIQKVVRGQAENIASMLEEVKSLIKNADADDLKNADSVVRKEIQAITKTIREASGNATDTIQDMLQYKIKKNADGSGQFVNKDGVPFGRKLTAVMIAGLGGSALYADDGSGDFGVKDAVGNLLLLGAAVFIGAKGMKAFQREGTIVKAVTKTYEDARGVVAANDALKKDTGWQWAEKQSMVIRTQLTETYAQFAKAGGTAKEMADKFLVNYADGIPQSAEIEKRRLARIAEAEIMKVENVQFKEWQKEMGYKATPITNFIDYPKQLDEFREIVIDTVDGLAPSKSNAVNAVATEFQTQMKKLYDEATEANVLGYGEGKIKYTKDYVPRYWKTSRIRNLLVGIDAKANRAALQTSIAEMMQGAVRKRRETAMKKYLDDVEEYRQVTNEGGKGLKKPVQPTFEGSDMDEAMKQANDFIKHSEGENIARRGRANEATMSRLEAEMEKQGLEMSDDMKAIFDKQGDKIDRAKYKIDLDYSKFREFTVKENGIEVKVGLGDIIDRDSKSIISRYGNEMGGSISLANKGYKTVNQARIAAGKIDDVGLQESMNKVIDSLAGEDLLAMGDTERKIFEAMTGVTFAAKLPLVTVSMLTELAKVMSYKNGFKFVLNNISSKIMRESHPKSMLVDELTKATGQGTASLRHEVNVKGIDEMSNQAENVGSAFGETVDAIRQVKETASRMYGLLQFSDFLQKTAMVANAQRVSDIIENMKAGKALGISEQRMKQFGITPERLENVGKYLKSENGEVMRLDFDKWDKTAQNDFNNMMFRMGQNVTQETTLGGTGMYMHNSSIGKAMGYLLTFPAEAFSNHGIRDLTTGDAEAAKNMFAMFIGGYISLKVRYAVEQKDVSDEEVMFRAVTGMPIFGAVSTVTGLTDPVVLSVMKNMTDIMKISNYEKDFTTNE